MQQRRIITLQTLFPDHWVPLGSMNGVNEWEAKWIIPDFLLKNGVNFLSGPGTLGKSYLRTYLVVVALAGAKAFGIIPTQKPENVLIMLGERNKWLEAKRIWQIGTSLGLSEDEIRQLPITMLEPCGFKIDHEKSQKAMIQTVEEHGFDLVSIDPLKAFHTRQENDAGSMSVVNNFFRHFGSIVTTHVVHHEGKPSETGGSFFQKGRKRTVGERQRGTSDTPAMADVSVSMEKVAKHIRKLEFETNWAEERNPMRLVLEDGLFKWTPSSPEEAVKYAKNLDPDMSASEIARNYHFRKEDVLKWTQKLYGDEP